MVEVRPASSLPRAERISTGDAVLDHFLGGGLSAGGGGLPCGMLTELCGEATAGKTQLALQLMLQAVAPRAAGGLAGAAVYVFTEGDPPLGRLRQLAAARAAAAGAGAPAAEQQAAEALRHVYVERGAATGAELVARLEALAPLLRAPPAGGRRVRLLVVDSVAHVFRDLGDAGGGGRAGGPPAELARRTALLFRLSALLRRYAAEHALAALALNQVTDAVPGPDGAPRRDAGHTGGAPLRAGGGREVAPALGLAWANCVSARLFAARGAPGRRAWAGDAAGGGGGVPPPLLRALRVVWAPHLPPGECHYVVEAAGVRGLHPAEVPPPPPPEALAPPPPAAGQQQQQQQQQYQQQGAAPPAVPVAPHR